MNHYAIKIYAQTSESFNRHGISTQNDKYMAEHISTIFTESLFHVNSEINSFYTFHIAKVNNYNVISIKLYIFVNEDFIILIKLQFRAFDFRFVNIR